MLGIWGAYMTFVQEMQEAVKKFGRAVAEYEDKVAYKKIEVDRLNKEVEQIQIRIDKETQVLLEITAKQDIVNQRASASKEEWERDIGAQKSAIDVLTRNTKTAAAKADLAAAKAVALVEKYEAALLGAEKMKTLYQSKLEGLKTTLGAYSS